MPPRLARLMQQEQPKPPPPKPVETPEGKAQARGQADREPKPVDTRKKMENSAAMRAIKDELADLRDQLDTKDLQNRQLKADVGQDARSERSLISSKVGVGSSGIVTAASSRGFGSGAGALSDHNTVGVSSRIAADAAAQPRDPQRHQRQGRAQRGRDRAGVRSQQGRHRRAVCARAARARRPAGQDRAAADDFSGGRGHRLPRCSAASSTTPTWSARSWRA